MLRKPEAMASKKEACLPSVAISFFATLGWRFFLLG
jgi:hypothetical protein